MTLSSERALPADAIRTTPVPPPGWLGSSSAAAPPSFTQAMVLLISSRPSVRQEFREALAGRPGLRVIEVGTVYDAIELTREVVVHLAVADADASSITHELPWLPTIFVASLDDVAPTVTGTRAQMLVRPLVPEHLQAMVGLILSR